MLYTCKISEKVKINNYAINKLFKIESFCNLNLYLKYNFIYHIVNNIQLAQNLTNILKA